MLNVCDCESECKIVIVVCWPVQWDRQREYFRFYFAFQANNQFNGTITMTNQQMQIPGYMNGHVVNAVSAIYTQWRKGFFESWTTFSCDHLHGIIIPTRYYRYGCEWQFQLLARQNWMICFCFLECLFVWVLFIRAGWKIPILRREGSFFHLECSSNCGKQVNSKYYYYYLNCL